MDRVLASAQLPASERNAVASHLSTIPAVMPRVEDGLMAWAGILLRGVTPERNDSVTRSSSAIPVVGGMDARSIPSR